MRLAKWIRWRVAVAAAIFLLLPIAEAETPHVGATPPRVGEAAEDLATRILWVDQAHMRAIFIPQRVLENIPIDELPLSSFDRHHLREQVENFAKGRRGCDYPDQAQEEQGSASKTYLLDELISYYPAAIVGVVQRIEAGWSILNLHAAEVAYVLVEEVVFERQGGRAPEKGAVVGAIYPGGSTVVGRTPVCQEREEAYYEPAVGDSVLLVGGLPPEGDSLHYVENMSFPISKEGAVFSQPYMNLDKEERWRALDELRPALAKLEQQLRSQA
jgi:hypothetical protein